MNALRIERQAIMSLLFGGERRVLADRQHMPAVAALQVGAGG